MFLQSEGKLAGCWVMRIDDDARRPPRARRRPTTPPTIPRQREKVIVLSNGTVTYVGKDMAYQFWKLGLLGYDFHYRRFMTRPDGRPLWATTSRRCRRSLTRHSAPRRPPSTSSMCARPTCRSC